MPPSARFLFPVALLAAAFMAVAGPFGTWQEPLLERLGFWVLGIGASGLAGLALDHPLRRIAWLSQRPGARALLIVALIAGPAGLLASVIAAALQRSPINWPLYFRTLPEILLVGVGLVALLRFAASRGRGAGGPAASDGPTPDGLLPLKFSGARLLALEAQDHYVRVHTDRGASLVLMAFGTALSKVAHLDGRRVHRSWWVARFAIAGVERGDGRATLSLQGGARAPVSRRFARALRSEGWY
ncbi:MAG: LytTR family DNA-binding domain-containing protein [Steroidobacteraceae bacterium]